MVRIISTSELEGDFGGNYYDPSVDGIDFTDARETPLITKETAEPFQPTLPIYVFDDLTIIEGATKHDEEETTRRAKKTVQRTRKA